MTEFIFDCADESLTAEQENVLKRAVETALAAEKIDFDCEVSVVITNNEGIREINRDYRNIDSATDVLSFPQYDFVSPAVFAQEPEIPAMLGDIVISKERLISQAEEIGHSFEDELAYLTVHSVLHLLGYDHMEENDKKIMREREKRIVGEIVSGEVF
ncbi:MAG: rRNA maturation RNase YbeY [Clostridia bacterium]|nr:rRNA maturation RNase YbeY [Clostridia bacterium]